MRKLRPTLFALLLLSPLAAYGQSTSQIFVVRSGRLFASITVSAPPEQSIMGSLREGLESEVQYRVRAYARTNGLLNFLGDKLVGEYRETYRASWDEFTGDFVVTKDGNSSTRTRSAHAFFSDFFELPETDTGIRLTPGRHYYVLSSVQIQTVRLVPPLTMIAPFLSQREVDTAWTKTEIGAP